MYGSFLHNVLRCVKHGVDHWRRSGFKTRDRHSLDDDAGDGSVFDPVLMGQLKASTRASSIVELCASVWCFSEVVRVE